MSEPTPDVLAERIKSLDRRIDERFRSFEQRINERFSALAEALKLAATGHSATIATYLSLGAILVSAITGLLLLWKGH